MLMINLDDDPNSALSDQPQGPPGWPHHGEVPAVLLLVGLDAKLELGRIQDFGSARYIFFALGYSPRAIADRHSDHRVLAHPGNLVAVGKRRNEELIR